MQLKCDWCKLARPPADYAAVQVMQQAVSALRPEQQTTLQAALQGGATPLS